MATDLNLWKCYVTCQTKQGSGESREPGIPSISMFHSLERIWSTKQRAHSRIHHGLQFRLIIFAVVSRESQFTIPELSLPFKHSHLTGHLGVALLTPTKIPGSIPSSSSGPLSTLRPRLPFHSHHSPLPHPHDTSKWRSVYPAHNRLLQASRFPTTFCRENRACLYALESEARDTELWEALKMPDRSCGYFYCRTYVMFRKLNFYLPTPEETQHCLSLRVPCKKQVLNKCLSFFFFKGRWNIEMNKV